MNKQLIGNGETTCSDIQPIGQAAIGNIENAPIGNSNIGDGKCSPIGNGAVPCAIRPPIGPGVIIGPVGEFSAEFSTEFD